MTGTKVGWSRRTPGCGSRNRRPGKGSLPRRLASLALGGLLTLTVGVSRGAAQDPAPAGPEAPAPAQDAPLKIAVVNVDRIAAQSPSGMALQARLQEFQQQLNQELLARQTAANEIQRRIAEAPDTMSVVERLALEREYQDALTAYQRFQQDKQREGQALQAEGLARVQAELQPVLVAIQEEQGFDLILNMNDNAIVLVSPRVNITQLVLDRLAAGGAGG